MKRRYARIALTTLLAVVVYQGLLASKRAEHWLVIHQLEAAGAPVAPGELAPELDRKIANAAPLYLAAMELNKKPSRLDHVKVGQELGVQAKEVLQQGALTFQMLEEAARRPQCVNDLDYDRGYDTRWPNYGAARRMIRLACHEMVVRAEQGRHSEARALAGHVFRFVQREIGPKGVTSHAIALSQAEELHRTLLLLDDRYPEMYLPPFYAELAALADRLDERLLEAVTAERASALHLFEKIRRGEEPVQELGLYSCFDLLTYRDELCYLKTAAAVERELKEQGAPEQLAQVVESVSKSCPLTKIITPSWHAIVKRHRKVSGDLHIKKIYY